MGLSQRQKGKRGERMLATLLREAFPELAGQIRRGWQSRAGDDEPDVVFPGVWFEHKFGAKLNPRAALQQAIDDSKGRRMPVAVIKDNGKKPFVAMRFDDFLTLLKAFIKQGEAEHDDRTVRRSEQRDVLHEGRRREVLHGSQKAGWSLRLRPGRTESHLPGVDRRASDGEVHRRA